ncbi:MAG: MFS transporter, partial [Myxococcales bacterium]|nr:MFS transporter [Polyangiaceae bacterium]MDW8248961.1 MFS transporter [Myxococcales bacterium]
MAGLSSATNETNTLSEDIKALLKCPRELWLVYLATFFEYVGIFTFLPTLPLWLSMDFKMSDERAGLWASVFSALVSLFVFLVGSIADAVGVRTTLLISFGLAALTRLGMSMAGTPNMAILSLLAFGFAYATTSPVLQTAVQRASSKRTRAFAFSLWYVSFNLSGALSGPIIDSTRQFFLDPETGKKLIPKVVSLPLLGERMMTANAAILGIGFLSAAIAVLVIGLLRRDFEDRVDPEDGPVEKKEKTHPIHALREVISDKVFWRFMLMLALLCLVRMMFQHMHFTWPKYVIR